MKVLKEFWWPKVPQIEDDSLSLQSGCLLPSIDLINRETRCAVSETSVYHFLLIFIDSDIVLVASHRVNQMNSPKPDLDRQPRLSHPSHHLLFAQTLPSTPVLYTSRLLQHTRSHRTSLSDPQLILARLTIYPST
jgi:hypothetical protein